MSRYVLLDTGPLGMLARRRPDPAVTQWVRALTGASARLAIAEIADYELRRELLRAGLSGSLAVLDGLPRAFDYMPITTSVLRRAADLWAMVRRQGHPTADPHALDGDVILAAQAHELINAGHSAVVATTNVGHLARLVAAQRWDTISG